MDKGLHARNRHRGPYDFEALCRTSPALASFVRPGPSGQATIDFADPEAVKTLNATLLAHFYGIRHWEIPPGYLCPPIPGRADYLHLLADLLATSGGGKIPRGSSTRILDIGVGACCIYPMVGHVEYGWSFVGTDTEKTALACAAKTVAANPALQGAIELRLQESPARILKGVIEGGEKFAASICNPPFHASLAEARSGSARKWRGLGKGGMGGRGRKETRKGQAPTLNFGGQGAELWCPGGEAAFVRRMIEESVDLAQNVRWFTTLVSKESNLRGVMAALKRVGAVETRLLKMVHGNKKSRVVAWSFFKTARA